MDNEKILSARNKGFDAGVYDEACFGRFDPSADSGAWFEGYVLGYYSSYLLCEISNLEHRAQVERLTFRRSRF